MKKTRTLDLPWVGISHNVDIKKQVFIEKGNIPQLMMFGRAKFLPNQSVDEHKHDSMYEVFYITSGKAIFRINGRDYEVEQGDCITIEQGELHSQSNPFSQKVEWIYFGIATD